MRWLLLAAALVGCGGDDTPAPRPQAKVALDATPLDAGVVMIDDAGEIAQALDHPAPRERRTIAVTLDSTPSGAAVLIDGVLIGNTPAYWEGEVNGCVREFRFEMPGYSTARYRFVPVRDGFVHGKLDRIIEDDGGVPELVEPEPLPPCPVRTSTPRPVHRPTAPSAPPVRPGMPSAAPADAAPAQVAPADAAPPPAPDAG